jgi:predicted metal-dependent hydrolase
MAKNAAPRNLPIFSEQEVEDRLHILAAGVQQYNDGYFFEAHETLEDLWMQSPWPIRRFLQGVIQLAAAFVHFVRHEYPGTVRLLGHAQAKLGDFAPRYMGIDVERLLSEVVRARDELVELGPERFEELASEHRPQIAFLANESSPSRKV